MTKEREVFKLALEALEMVKANADDWQERTGKEIKGWMQPVNNSITAIKEALAQPEHHTLTSRVNDVRFHKERDEQRDEAMKMLAQPEQEPVAWQVEVLIQGVWSPMGNPQRDKSRAEKLAANPSIPKECQRVIGLYTTPPQRTAAEGEDKKTWVGLDEEDEIDWEEGGSLRDLVEAVEAKLKEKNT